MKQVLVIAKKEFSSYFNSPVAYIVISVFLLITGYLFFQQVFLAGQASMRGLFTIASILFIFFSPALTMRLISEERKAGTLELMVTLPLTNTQIVVGKFLAALGLLGVAILLTLPYSISISFVGDLDWGPVIGGYIGLILVGGAYLSLGLFCSAISRNQIVAFIIGLALCFTVFIMDKILMFLPSFLASIFEYLSVDYHFGNIARGVIDSRGLLYYGTFISIFLMLSVYALENEKLK
jgi:ABC-2 type transport system permease protein